MAAAQPMAGPFLTKIAQDMAQLVGKQNHEEISKRRDAFVEEHRTGFPKMVRRIRAL